MVLRALAVLLLAGCLPKPAPVRLLQQSELALVTVVERAGALELAAPPAALRDELARVGLERNLAVDEVELVGGVPVRERFAVVRDSGRRLAELAAADDAPLRALVESTARYFTQIAGRFRWTVSARLSLADAGGVVLDDELELPVILELAHQDAGDAIAAAAPAIAERLGRLLDEYLRGRAPAARVLLPQGSAFAGAAAAPRSDVLYFVLVDRFANGEPANDGAIDRADPSAWHGGDLQGVAARLDYLRDLGVGSVWLSPVFATRAEPFHGHGAFHGYWTYDLGRIDERFGGMPALLALRDGLRRRGMGLLLDMVVNHVGYDAPLVQERPEWFHHNGSIYDWSDPRQLETFDVHGLPDLALERDDVFAHVDQKTRSLIERVRPDGLRLDAVKHVPVAFWARYNQGLAQAFGDDFITLGEIYDGRPSAVSAVQAQGRFSHVFDFPLAFALRDVFCKDAPLGELAAVLSEDRAYADARRLYTFADNHDLPRLASTCGGELSRTMRALSALLALRGTPTLTYGTEVGLLGEAEPHNRGDMRFEVDAPLYRHLRERIALRRSLPVLSGGRTHVLWLAEQALVLLVTDGTERALVTINNGSTALTPRLPALAGCAPLRLAPFSVEARALEGCRPEAALQPVAPRRLVRFITPSGAGERYAVVGSGAELGNWDPGSGKTLVHAPDGDGVTVDLPVGAVFAYKLVRREVDGRLTWDAGKNHYLHVPAGEGAHVVRLAFRAPAGS